MNILPCDKQVEIIAMLREGVGQRAVSRISTDGLNHYRTSIRDAFGKKAVHGIINKTYSEPT